MASTCALLNLPRELRDEVYRHYVTFEEGLVYNFDYDAKGHEESCNNLRNLAPANNTDSIDLALRSTCKQIHGETDGLILKFNTITFSSTRISRNNSDEVRVRAARFHFLRVPRTMEAASFLYYEDGPVVRPCYTQAVVDEVVRTHPSIGPLLRILLKENTPWAEINSAHKVLQARPHEHCPESGQGPTGSWGIVRSSMRAALMHALKVTADHDCFSSGPAVERPTFPPRELLALDSEFPAWSLPTDDDLLKLSRPYAKKTADVCINGAVYCHASRQLHTAEFWNGQRYLKRWILDEFSDDHIDKAENRGKYRFSAASVAIKFLSSLPSGLRLYLRHIRLLEKNVSVAFPESHAHGLIKFCVENPKLRVERRVSVWKTILQQQSHDSEHQGSDLEATPEDQRVRAWIYNSEGFSTVRATNNIALWMMEAASLIPAGMPKDSFTLVLDGAPGDDVLSDVFIKYIQRDAAWQMAWQISLKDKAEQSEIGEEGADDFFMRLRGPCCYIYKDFPLVLDDIINNRSELIQCTFNTGPKIWDVETELNKYRALDDAAWDIHRHEHKDMFYWRQLGREEYFDKVVYGAEILPYEEDQEYFSD
ncbi:hypothetical protein KVR01_009178 [Diaporthe batatas]|uniref:uncharacterized protein n=1 Tax=Diaporthe batatas TaxID=748121 RepID=UPI001D05145F|nr:uncharacterized protein KVR01_009178 [Diaporthe batatas]KAG8160914.1 hypothetical protein KVR01_009178 [Diaporthe batatas]